MKIVLLALLGLVLGALGGAVLGIGAGLAWVEISEHCLWRFWPALHRAINERQLGDIEPLIDEDVQWSLYGPVDMFPFFGARRAKAAVLEVIRQIAENVRVHRFDRESILLGVDTAASMMRYSLTALDSNKPISLRLAHFAQFREGRLFSLRILVDTYELVEQALGRPLQLPKIALPPSISMTSI